MNLFAAALSIAVLSVDEKKRDKFRHFVVSVNCVDERC